MPKRILQGVVVSSAGEKTAIVRVERRMKHPVLGKVMRRSKRYHAHDEGNSCTVGDKVRIVECPPISKLKRWRVMEETA
ncbi:MAG: 30S ribosomal protein S17 [Alphaproteobacteria bacterium]